MEQDTPKEPSTDTTDIDLSNALTIETPLAGNYYGASSPDKPSFVTAGDTVKAGQPVCIVEAMKLINEITAKTDCKIIDILVTDGQSVVKGQPLMVIEEA